LYRPAPACTEDGSGPEFTAASVRQGLARIGVKTLFIEPGSPWENGYVESFNGKLRDECLNSQWFESRDDARRAIHDWQEDYNERRPHSALGDRSPSEFAAEFLGFGLGASLNEPRNSSPGLGQ
jgi:putative transposase